MSGKKSSFAQKSIIISVYPEPWKHKMGISLDANFGIPLAVFTFLHFFTLFMVEKCDSLQVVNSLYPKIEFWSYLGQFCQSLNFLPKIRWVFPAGKSKKRFSWKDGLSTQSQ